MLRKYSDNTDGIQSAYAAAGVDIDAANDVKERISKDILSTMQPEVIRDKFGFFCGLYELKGYKHPVIVSNTDGVGTKLEIATAMDKYNTVGIDLVYHCVNDILTSGADPLFFLDYIAVGKLVPYQVEGIIKGLTIACRDIQCSLIKGETAQMPGIFIPGGYELAGAIVGCVEKENILKNETIKAGDIILGLPSSGIHTNGYSLVRKVFTTQRMVLDTYYRELNRTLGEELLEPHRCYYKDIKPVLPWVKGLAHITGSGMIGNIPRILPDHVNAHLNKNSWTVPAIFDLIQHQGKIDEREMYHVFNMGIGMAIICSADNAPQIKERLPDAITIGEVISRTDDRRIVIE